MCHIIGDMSKYVPSEKAVRSITIDGEEHTYDTSEVFQLLFFGDQLTVARARSALALRYLYPNTLNRLKGFIPTIVDWHARQCFLKVQYTINLL